MTDFYHTKELTPAQIEIITDCVPVLEDLNIKLGEKFYKRTMKRYSQLKPYFNETHHKLLRQPRAFIYTLIQFAKNIHDLSPLEEVLERIVNKHVGLQVKPEQYQMLGEVLLETMVDLFPPEMVGDEFVEAWSTVYSNLANMLIEAERVEYSKKAWFGFKEFRVTRFQTECVDTKSFFITPVDGKPIPKPERGQYLCMRWILPGAKFEKSRVYSISEYPIANEYRLTVRNIPGGQVSGYIHNKLKVGDIIYSGPPCGCIYYKSNKTDLVVLAGGNGISALMPIIEAGLEECRNVILMYSNRSTETRSFSELLKKYKLDYGKCFRVIEFISRERHNDPIDQYCNRSLTLEDLEFIKPEHDVYLIGPRGYMKMIDDYLRSRDVKPHLDYFGPQEVIM